MTAIIRIEDREIGPGRPCFIIAEAGVNHNGDLDRAKQLVEAAFEAGADAVKFQAFRAERLISAQAPKAEYQLRTTDTAQSQLEMIRSLELGRPEHAALMEFCADRGITFLSSPFEEGSADWLNEIGVAAFKIPSGEIINLPFLRHVARMGKPMIVSTGMSSMQEVEAAVSAIREAGENADYGGLVLLQCVSNYPADPKDVNLRAMETMARAFEVGVGYSDHIAGNEVAFAAVALGACVIEKHFTLDRTLVGPDHQASLEPSELKDLVDGIRNVEAAMGTGVKEAAASEQNTADVARKSIVVSGKIAAGTTLTEEMLTLKRPGTGLSPSKLGDVVGRKTRVDLEADSMLKMEQLE